MVNIEVFKTFINNSTEETKEQALRWLLFDKDGNNKRFIEKHIKEFDKMYSFKE